MLGWVQAHQQIDWQPFVQTARAPVATRRFTHTSKLGILRIAADHDAFELYCNYNMSYVANEYVIY